MKIKVFMLDSKAGKSLANVVARAFEIKGIDLEGAVIEEEVEVLPKEYDLYFLHLNDILDKETLNQLKRLQPESYFIEIGVGGGYFQGTRRIREESHLVFSTRDIEKILEEYLIK